MKNKFFLFLFFFTYCFYFNLNSDNYNISELKKIVEKHIENTKKIDTLEKKMINFKFISGNEILNILNRKNIEKNIQKRNQIIKEINNLISENKVLNLKLYEVHNLLYADLKNNYKNNIFRFVIDYIDSLKTDYFNKIIFLDDSEVKRLYNENKIELLHIKYESQSKILTELNNFINILKIKSDIYKLILNNNEKENILRQINLLNNILSNAKLSQQIILNTLNNK